MERLQELYKRYQSDLGIVEAKKKAINVRIDELLHELRNQQLNNDQKLDRVIKILEFMNMRNI